MLYRTESVRQLENHALYNALLVEGRKGHGKEGHSSKEEER